MLGAMTVGGHVEIQIEITGQLCRAGLGDREASYGYELLQRFRSRYEGLLEVNSPSHVYSALSRLEAASLIVGTVPSSVEGAAPDRQPKVHYRPTADGPVAFSAWLAARLQDDEERIELLGRLAAVGGRDLDVLAGLLAHYDAECAERVLPIPLADRAGAAAGVEPGSDFVRRLIVEERRYVLDAQMQWIAFAREEMLDRRARLQESRNRR